MHINCIPWACQKDHFAITRLTSERPSRAFLWERTNEYCRQHVPKEMKFPILKYQGLSVNAQQWISLHRAKLVTVRKKRLLCMSHTLTMPHQVLWQSRHPWESKWAPLFQKLDPQKQASTKVTQKLRIEVYAACKPKHSLCSMSAVQLGLPMHRSRFITLTRNSVSQNFHRNDPSGATVYEMWNLQRMSRNIEINCFQITKTNLEKAPWNHSNIKDAYFGRG